MSRMGNMCGGRSRNATSTGTMDTSRPTLQHLVKILSTGTRPRKEMEAMTQDETIYDELDKVILHNTIELRKVGKEEGWYDNILMDLLTITKAVRTLMPSSDETPSPSQEHSQAGQDEADPVPEWRGANPDEEDDQRKSSSNPSITKEPQPDTPTERRATEVYDNEKVLIHLTNKEMEIVQTLRLLERLLSRMEIWEVPEYDALHRKLREQIHQLTGIWL